MKETLSKMEYAIGATIKFMSMLTENLFDIVAFDNVAVISQPLTHVDEKNFSIIADNIRKITPRDRTNIADVIKTTKSMITVKLAKQYNCKIILCSDGEANVGISDENSLAPIALDCMRSGITVSALGMGVSYNARIMGSIANSGGGIFHHIEDLSKLPDIFKKELGLSTSVLAREVKLILEIPKLIEIGQNLNGYPQSVSNNTVEVFIGDIHAARRVIFEIRCYFYTK